MTTIIKGPDFSITDALNHLTSESVLKDREEGKDISKMPLRPSAAGQCERELAYALQEYRGLAKYDKPLLSPETMRIFSLGHSVEYSLLSEFRKYFKDVFDLRYQQQVLSFGALTSKHKKEWSYVLEGSIDFVLWGKQFKMIGDVKSKKEKYSSYRDSSWEEDDYKYSKMRSLVKIGDTGYYADNIEAFLEELNDPFIAANVLQLNLYAMNPFITERNIDSAFLVYYNKNTSKVRELRWRPSQGLYDYVINKFKNAFNAVEEEQVEQAKKEFRLGSMKCAFCSYKATCWSEEDALKKWFKNLPPKSWPKDTHRMEGFEALEQLYSDYNIATTLATDVEELDQKICNVLVDEGVSKVRFSDGSIFEVKLYKSPKEHYRLKRSK
jgi:CRISPR/Cas system-associated exonuclease Cas4 (RecB family)